MHIVQCLDLSTFDNPQRLYTAHSSQNNTQTKQSRLASNPTTNWIQRWMYRCGILIKSLANTKCRSKPERLWKNKWKTLLKSVGTSSTLARVQFLYQMEITVKINVVVQWQVCRSAKHLLMRMDQTATPRKRCWWGTIDLNTCHIQLCMIVSSSSSICVLHSELCQQYDLSLCCCVVDVYFLCKFSLCNLF